MAGVNLSQSMASGQGKEKRHMFAASGFPMSIILLLLTIAGFGGLRWYLYTLDQKIANLDATISVNGDRLVGESIDRVADFDARVTLLGTDPAELIDPQALFVKLESLVVPQVLLTKYEYNDRDKVVVIFGKTENFRYLAEQIISFRSDPSFAELRVDTIDRDDKGAIEFVLRNNF